MSILTKIIRAGNEDRRTRFHTLRGNLIPKREIATAPIELFLRCVGLERKGPWLSKSAVREISKLLRDGKHTRVLEIGGGRSTTYFSKHTSFLMTIEEDAEWARKIQTQISKSKHEFVLVNTELSLWLNSRNKHNMDFDIVLIDGGSDEARKRSLEILPTLNPKAIYILDNSDRDIFKEINFELKPLHTTRFSGLIRNPFQATETTFFYFEL
ncbi:MAG: hypothetical protein EBX09_05745 [Actinobacteria bacterium]|jgi:hypothetical protein|nr:hypothetical protein [Actinomycetota bacterium]NCX76525.1 hypothetical protein [Actinomycetota bacterium]